MADSNEKIVVITGCSVGGIGYALALAFAERQCRVVATSRSLRSMDGLDRHPRIHPLALDVLSHESIDEAVSSVVERFGRIDILVNNAGVSCIGPLAELPLSAMESTINTNVYGPMRLIQAVVPHMISQGRGKIVNVGSTVVWAPGPWVGGYTASKAAVHALSDTLRVELKPFGIDVMIVAPGAIHTNIASNSSANYSRLPEWRIYKPFKKAIDERVFLTEQRGCTPEMFANKTAESILKKCSPAVFSYGHYSTTSAIMYYLPVWLRDFLMAKSFGLSDIMKKDD
eukprot:Gb_33039 [translate_table: standard]